MAPVFTRHCRTFRWLYGGLSGWTENAVPENGGPKKMKDIKMQDLKITDQMPGHENAGPENKGPQKQDRKMDTCNYWVNYLEKCFI